MQDPCSNCHCYLPKNEHPTYLSVNHVKGSNFCKNIPRTHRLVWQLFQCTLKPTRVYTYCWCQSEISYSPWNHTWQPLHSIIKSGFCSEASPVEAQMHDFPNFALLFSAFNLLLFDGLEIGSEDASVDTSICEEVLFRRLLPWLLPLSETLSSPLNTAPTSDPVESYKRSQGKTGIVWIEM